ncbi:hypothetical protein [Geothermobacter hydrogeniphilus]|uniref:Uncharacterized protein n=1 Tax=Geothermobacter hydrogeniphilus TaxID=1969733 RepID=A0A1X0Y669_9BACT|nr:hypothetical protein [Geothermobacter hydrogeniphilus]ORJ60609.1 hypothetical protein B5V00_07170 [Geothermobacter hydrogeniphilus]
MVRIAVRKFASWFALFTYLLLWHGLAHGVVLCMDADGRSHLEVHSVGSCSEGSSSTGGREDSSARLKIKSLCEDYAPDILAYKRSPAPVSVLAPPAVSSPFFVWPEQKIFPPVAAAGRYLQPTGPPRVALTALKTTILRY